MRQESFVCHVKLVWTEEEDDDEKNNEYTATDYTQCDRILSVYTEPRSESIERRTCRRRRVAAAAQDAKSTNDDNDCASTSTSKANVWAWWKLMRESKHKLARLAKKKPHKQQQQQQ